MIAKITLLDLEDRGQPAKREAYLHRQPDRDLLMMERDFAVTRACGRVKLSRSPPCCRALPEVTLRSLNLLIIIV